MMARSKRRLLRDGFESDFLRTLLEAAAHVDHADLTPEEGAQLKEAREGVEDLHGRLLKIEEEIEALKEKGEKEEFTALVSSAHATRKELVKAISAVFAHIIPIIPELLFGSRSDKDE